LAFVAIGGKGNVVVEERLRGAVGERRMGPVPIVIVTQLGQARRIVGIDVCGDVALLVWSGPLRPVLLMIRRPVRDRLPGPGQTGDSRGNARLIETFRSVL
jgi:hypothetical protein